MKPRDKTGKRGRAKSRRGLVGALSILTVALAACAPDPASVVRMINEINNIFQKEYEEILAETGVRRYRVRGTDAFVALHAALSKLGMRVVDQDPDLGTLVVSAPATFPRRARPTNACARRGQCA